MEYLLGSLITLLSLIFLNIKINRDIGPRLPVPLFSQSRKFDLVKIYFIKKSNDTQSFNDKRKSSHRALVYGDAVYWIEDGYLVTADFIDGQIDRDSKKRVDTHNLDKVELDRVIFIVEKLTEGDNNDSGNSRNKEF